MKQTIILLLLIELISSCHGDGIIHKDSVITRITDNSENSIITLYSNDHHCFSDITIYKNIIPFEPTIFKIGDTIKFCK